MRVPKAVRRGRRVGLSNGSGYFYCLDEMEAKVAVGFWNCWIRKVCPSRRAPAKRRRSK